MSNLRFENKVYSLREYGNMIADAERFSAYRSAIRRAVQPGDVVAEIGCGPAIFSFLACQSGARRVYAIESEPVIDVARRIAAENCFSDRIEFIYQDSLKAELPERVRVIISDIRGALPLFGTATSTIADAKNRFLAESGLLIPERDVLKVALVEAPNRYQNIIFPWSAAVPDLSLSVPLAHALNTESYHNLFHPEQLLSATQTWSTLNYYEVASRHITADLMLSATRAATAHGLCIWFEAKLYDEIGYSTGPGTSKNSISGQLFLPWLEPVLLGAGQSVNVLLKVDLVGAEYMWRWETKIIAQDGRPARHFVQSSLQGAILSPESLRRRAADFVPSLSEQGQADRFLIDSVDGKTSLQQIAHSAASKFPRVFSRWEDALSRAADLAAQFST